MANSTMIYVASAGDNKNPPAILFFDASNHGNVPPAGKITGPHTQLDGNSFGVSVAIAATQNTRLLYVSNPDTNSVMIYDTGTAGDLSPIRVIQGSATQLNQPMRMCVDDAGQLFVVNWNGGHGGPNSITVYDVGADGNAAPIRVIKGDRTVFGDHNFGKFPSPSIGLNGELIVATSIGDSKYDPIPDLNTVLIFAPAADGDVAPVRMIAGNNTGLKGAWRALPVASRGEIYVLDGESSWLGAGPIKDFSIKVFSYSDNGNVSPRRVLSGPATGLVGNDSDVFLDMAFSPVWHDALYVATTGYGSVPPAIVVHSLDASGNQPPLRTISGAQTGLYNLCSVALWAGDHPPMPLCPDLLETISVLTEHIAELVVVYQETGGNPLIGKRIQTLERLLANLEKQAARLGCLR